MMLPKAEEPTSNEPVNGEQLKDRYRLYGWRRLRCGGVISEPWFAYAILCACTFIQNFSVNGANNAVISTLERAFYLNSVQSGLFLALYDLATVFSAPLVGYLAGIYASPIFFSLNMIIVGMGNILIASSNFLSRENRLTFSSGSSQQYLVDDSVLFQCYRDPSHPGVMNDTGCLRTPTSPSLSDNAKILLYFGNFVNGIGSVALFTIGVAYIERIFPRQRAAYAQGFYFALGSVGSALGILATGRFLSLHTRLTPRRRLPTWLIPAHPLWIGCWWLPYIIYGLCCFLIGIVVSGLPNFEQPGQQHKHMKSQTIARGRSPVGETSITTYSATAPEEDQIERDRAHDKLPPVDVTTSVDAEKSAAPGVDHRACSTDTIDSPSVEQHTVNKHSDTMLLTVIALMKNTRYLFIIIANLFEGILLKGFVPFVSKYFEYQHQLDTSTATLITGVIALLAIFVGCPVGAYAMNKFSWNPMRCARVCAVVFSVSAFLFLFLIFSCPELKFQYTPCSSRSTTCCHNVYHPVCNVKEPNQMFLSPCHHGCTDKTVVNSTRTNHYSSCDCAANTNATVSESACEFRRIPCTLVFGLTVTGATFVVFFTAFIQVPMLHVLLYSVAVPHQSMALALRQTLVRVLGQTTGPLLFGFVFDQSCLVWLTDCYGRRTCKVYKNRRMGLSMALLGFSTRIVSGTACAVVYLIWKRRHANEGVVVLPSNGTVAPIQEQGRR